MVPWVYSPHVMEEWADVGTYLGNEEDKAPTLALQRGQQQVRVRWSSAWADAELPAPEMAAALSRLDRALTRKFLNNGLNFGSPVALGRHLMASCWRLDGIQVPPAPPEIRQLLTEHSPQGRHELLWQSDEPLPALYQYDMRLAYLWCCKALPYGSVERAEWATGDLERAHKWNVYWKSDGWRHIGLLPQRRQGWIYPLQGEGWIDRRELELANRNYWHWDAIEGLTWEREGALDRWSDGLQECLRQSKDDAIVYRMLRRVALNTIGSLHRSTVKRYRALPKGRESDLPAGNPTLRMSEDGSRYFWSEEEPVRGRGLIYVHPEWTTTIWARCRARVAQAALQFPREQLVAIRQDALFTTHPHPTWKETDRVGGFRLKEILAGPLPAPRTLEEFDTMRRDAHGHQCPQP